MFCCMTARCWPAFLCSADAGEEGGGAFVGAALPLGEFGFGGHEFAKEGLGEDGLRQLPGPSCCGGQATFDCFGQLEQGRDAVDDLALLG